MNTDYRHMQLRDYLTQVIGLSKKKDLPKINQTTIQTQLDVTSGTVSKFLSETTLTSPKMLTNFKAKYRKEYEKWPEGKKTIKRVLTVNDALYFLGLPQKNAVPKPIAQKAVAAPSQQKRLDVKPAAESPKKAVVPARATKAVTAEKKLKNPVLIAPQVNQAANKALAPIAISYRGHESDKDGAGMLFDHMRIQDSTKFPTVTLLPHNEEAAEKAENYFKKALKDHTAKLLFGIENKDLVKIPPTTLRSHYFGLLVIPGRVRAIEDEPTRLEHEYHVIRHALNRGQPILGICAGSWRLYEQMYNWTQHPRLLKKDPVTISERHKQNGSLVAVNDHCYGGGMLRLGKDGVKACYNVQIHDIDIKEDSLLKIAMNDDSTMQDDFDHITVNSVHWNAVNENRIPLNTLISAKALQSPDIKINNRQKKLMEPEEGTVEAFESEFGAPIMGIQWHPEGYNELGEHRSLLKYMAQAGNAFAARSSMVRSFNVEYPIVINNLKKVVPSIYRFEV